METQAANALGGTITVVLNDGTGYMVGTENTAIVTVNDISIPVLSIADASETLAGSDAQFVVTSSIPFVGDLEVTYRPAKTNGDYLNETDGDGTAVGSGTNTNAGLDRKVTLTFAQDGDSYTATLPVATVDDTADTDGVGTITITLQDDPADPDTYTVSTTLGANTAMVSVIEVPVPELTISSTDVTVGEGVAAIIVVEASVDPKRELTFNYTPTETGNTSYLAPITQDGVTKGVRR